MEPDQTSLTGVGPGLIIIFCRRSSLSQRSNQSQPTWALTKYLQYLLVIPWSPLGLDHLCRQTPSLSSAFQTDALAAWIISNQRHGSLKYFQLTPGCTKWRHSSSRAVWNIYYQTSSNKLDGSTGYLTPQYIFFPVLYGRVALMLYASSMDILKQDWFVILVCFITNSTCNVVILNCGTTN